jgi:hypothetical protein
VFAEGDEITLADIKHSNASRFQEPSELQRVPGVRENGVLPKILAIEPQKRAPRLHRPHRIVDEHGSAAGQPPVGRVDADLIVTLLNGGPIREVQLQRVAFPLANLAHRIRRGHLGA